MIWNGNAWKLVILDSNSEQIISKIVEKTINYSQEKNEMIKQIYNPNKAVINRLNTIDKHVKKCDYNYLQYSMFDHVQL